MKVQRGRRGEQEKGECWEVLETAERGVRESKRDSVGWETFLSLSVCLSFCFAWPGCAGLACLPACLPGMYTAQGGQWISLNDTKARELRLGMKPLTSHNLPLLQIKRHEKSEKNSFDLPSLSLLSPPFLRLSPRPSALVYAPFIVKPFLSRSTSSSSGCLSWNFSQHDVTARAVIVLMARVAPDAYIQHASIHTIQTHFTRRVTWCITSRSQALQKEGFYFIFFTVPSR